MTITSQQSQDTLTNEILVLNQPENLVATFDSPENLISIPFITRLSELLVPGGWLVGNFWTLNGDFEEHLNRWDKIFPTLYQARTRPTANKILFGRKNGKASLNGSLKDRAHFLQKKSGLDMLKMLVNLEKVE